jgi:hypothetical protein
MYIAKSYINGLEETATYPIVLSVAQDMHKLLGLVNPIRLVVGENEPLLLDKNDYGVIKHIPDILDEELRIEYSEEYSEGYELSLSTVAPINLCIYKDNDIHSYITPVLSRRTLTLSITYYAKSKSKADRLVNRLRMKSATDTRQMYHDIEYSYYIPDNVLMLLDMLNSLKNTHTTPIVDLDQYVANTFNTTANIINTEDGNPSKGQLAIRERQLSVLGSIDTDVYALTKNFDSETERWSFSIDYKLDYDMPTQLISGYPLAVYNQAIPKEYMLRRPLTQPKYGRHTAGEGDLKKLTTRQDMLLSAPDNCYYLRIPLEDNLVLPEPEPYYVRLFTVFTLVDLAAPKDIFFLDELPNITFKPDVLELIKLESARISEQYKSIFYIEIYNFDKKMYSQRVNVTVVTELVKGVSKDRVKLTTATPLDIKGNYRIVFNMLSDLTTLPDPDFRLLKDNIATVDAHSVSKFSVIDSVVGVLDLDITNIKSELVVTDATTSMEIALHVKHDVWKHMFTKQISAVLTEMLALK